MKNSFKMFKDTFTSKLKNNVLKCSMLLVKKSKFMIYKKVRALLKVIIARIYNSLVWVKYPVFSMFVIRDDLLVQKSLIPIVNSQLESIWGLNISFQCNHNN